jgi:hypothetical protein
MSPPEEARGDAEGDCDGEVSSAIPQPAVTVARRRTPKA